MNEKQNELTKIELSIKELPQQLDRGAAIVLGEWMQALKATLV